MYNTARDKILSQTNNGYDVFRHYLGEETLNCGRRLFSNPFRKDVTPSCRLKYKKTGGGGAWMLIDYGASEWCGDCFSMVAKSKLLDVRHDFVKVLHIIDEDMNLFVFNNEPADYKPKKATPVSMPKSIEDGGVIAFRAIYRTFTSWEKRYWQRYGISQDILERYNVRSLNLCRFERRDGSKFTMRSNYQEAMYGYVFSCGQGIKVYRPYSKIRFLYAGNLPKPYIFGMEQLPEKGQYVIITGGEKDVMSLAAHGFPAICLNSETATLCKELVSNLTSRFDNLFVLYDMDETGRNESSRQVALHAEGCHICRLELPLTGEKKQKDVSDFFALGHTRAELEDIINSKLRKGGV